MAVNADISYSVSKLTTVRFTGTEVSFSHSSPNTIKIKVRLVIKIPIERKAWKPTVFEVK